MKENVSEATNPMIVFIVKAASNNGKFKMQKL